MNNSINLPHQVVQELGFACDGLSGEGSRMPGPPMPQLPFDRTPILLLGSYLNNLTNQIQRVLPYMTRTGDLMQRESLLTTNENRISTAEMAN